MADEEEELIVQLLIEQQSLKIQMIEVNSEAIKEKMGITRYQLYAIKHKHINRIYADGALLAREARMR